MFDLRQRFAEWCALPSLVEQPTYLAPDFSKRAKYDVRIRLFSKAAVIPANPVLNDLLDSSIFPGDRNFGNDAWAERRVVSPDSCGAISSFLLWQTAAPGVPDGGDAAKIGGYFVYMRYLDESQLITYRRIEPARDMRAVGARYGMFVTVDMTSTTFTPP